jgi:serine/threonine-protein kinase
MRHTARALDYALRLGVIHRDVKPSNIFYADGDRRIVCLGDFGLAKVRGLGTVTRQGQVIGSIYYMAPEQVRGLINMTARSDVYSLGVVLYEMLTGRMPFEGQSQANILHAIVHGDPPQPRQFSNAITPEMERVILRALNKDPDRRYATAGELAAAFQNTLPNGGQVATPPARRKAGVGPRPPRARAEARVVAARAGGGQATTQRSGFWLAILGLLALLLLMLYLAN